jgi:hypothetical protein
MRGVTSNGTALAAGADRRVLCDILLRCRQGFSFSFLKATWSINIPNLLTSPLTIAEFAVALVVMGLIRLAIGVVPGRAHRSNAYAARY